MSYESQWQEYRKRSKWFLWVFLTYVPGAATLGIITTKLLNTDSETPFIVIAIIWMVAFAVTGVRLSLWKCPRCGKWFSTKLLYHNIASKKCLHCGLPKWSNDES